MDRLFLIAQRSVYRHKIQGVFDTLDAAINACIECIRQEPDHFHQQEILERNLNDLVVTDEIVCTVTYRFNGPGWRKEHPTDYVTVIFSNEKDRMRIYHQ